MLYKLLQICVFLSAVTAVTVVTNVKTVYMSSVLQYHSPTSVRAMVHNLFICLSSKQFCTNCSKLGWQPNKEKKETNNYLYYDFVAII